MNQPSQTLIAPLTHLKGVGPKKAALLAQKGLHTVFDLLFFRPIRYQDRTQVTPLEQIQEGGAPVLIQGKVVNGREERFFPSRKSLFKILMNDNHNLLELIWFQYRKAHLMRVVNPGTTLMAFGNIKVNKGRKQMIHPDIMILNNNKNDEYLGIYPIYSSVQGISGRFIRSIIKSACDQYLESMIDPIPKNVIHKLDLPDLAQTILYLHFPPARSSIDKLNKFDTKWHKRLIFDRFFVVMSAIAYMKKSREKVSCTAYQVPLNFLEKAEKFFPFQLTSQQRLSLEEIRMDFLRGIPMKRLLMGDVGCGKTVVAALAALMNIQNKKQVAIMVPTQVLAKQHFEYFSTLTKEMGFHPVLLTGDLKKKEREAIYKKIRENQYNLVIGTHSLIQKGVIFADLGLVIIDEQHRFGVKQRA